MQISLHRFSFAFKIPAVKTVLKREKEFNAQNNPEKRLKGIWKVVRRVKRYNHAQIQIIIDAKQIKTKCIDNGE